MSEVVLKVSGKEYAGWKSVKVNKSLNQLTGTFGFAATDIAPDKFSNWGISLGDECTVEIDNQLIINGYIDDLPISYDSNSHNIQISGRDKTEDLVDCSYVETSAQFKALTIQSIIENLCKPFGIKVSVDASVFSQAVFIVSDFTVDQGMTVFEAMKPLLDTNAILPVSYADGKLTLTRAGTIKTSDTLELGKNILTGSINQSLKDRYSNYIVKGQGKSSETKTTEVYTGAKGEVTDLTVPRYRPLLIIPDDPIEGNQDCVTRATWEANTRAGKSIAIQCTVQGWTQTNGQVWPLNAIVYVRDQFLGVNSEFLISEVSFSLGEGSAEITAMTLVHPETYDTFPNSATNVIKTQASWRNLLGPSQ